jgi:hypothetical protein
MVALLLAAGLVAASACSDNSGDRATPTTAAASPTSTTTPRPAGPAADLTTELRGGQGVFIGAAVADDLAAAGYVEHEYAATGTATSYRARGERSGDGRWAFEPAERARYRTRVLVRLPADARRFSGTVVVEWLNVSGGVDANPEWTSVAEEIVRSGHAWVGVSAQHIGVEGGPVLVQVEGLEQSDIPGKGLKAIDPDRYGSLQHPGDGFAFDIFTQVARALRQGAGLGGARPARLLAAGESQSAFALVTYYNGVQPLTRAFDGFFVHSRGAAGLPLVTGDGNADIAGAITEAPAIFRTDGDAPVLDIQTESDVTSVLNSYAARQRDSRVFRLWEVAGTAHADAHLLGPTAAGIDCGVPINDGPMHVVAKAALHALVSWVDDGKPPARAPRLGVAAGPPPQIRRDADGIARGGIRTPPVDVPVAALTGVPGPKASTICLLLGSTRPLSSERLRELYASRSDYLQRYEQAADAAIAAGFVLADDRDALMAFARPDAVGA